MPYSTLPEGSEGARIFEEIYNKSLKEYNNDKEKAARTAWAGLKQAGYSKDPDSGKWEKKSALAELSMTIVKASFEKSDQTMRFRAVASDTDPDLYGEQMTPELFRDFVDRIENDTPVPEAFKSAICEEDWCGGLPYPSIAHYKSASGHNVPGLIDNVYVDGNRLKSTGLLTNNDLGRAVFKSLCDDLYNKKNQVEQDPVRISIGFLDLAHSHIGQGMNYTFERKGMTDICPMCAQHIGGKKYLKGVLVHEAFTRVPVNPRTEAEVIKSMSEIKTKKDDAESIVGELAESLVDKSKAGDVLTVKADGTLASTNAAGVLTSEYPTDGTIKNVNRDAYADCYDPNTGGWNSECVEQYFMGHTIPMRADWQYDDADHRPDKDDGKTANTVAKSDYFDMFSVNKKEEDGEHPACHYLVREDPTESSKWHLRVKDASGKINTRLLGAAHAALTKGYRGNKYEGPDKGKALAKLHSLYTTAGLDWPGEEKSIMETKGKIVGGKVPFADEVKPFEADEDEIYPEVASKDTNIDPASAPKKYPQKAKTAKPYEGKETKEEEDAEEKDEMDSGKKEKALVSACRSLIGTVMNLKAQGVSGEAALQAIQPAFDTLGVEVKRSLTTTSFGGDDLASIVRAAVAEATAPLQQELAILKAQGAQVNRSNVGIPRSRSLSLTPMTLTAMKSQTEIVGDQTGNLTPQKSQFSQIRNLARKSTGL